MSTRASAAVLGLGALATLLLASCESSQTKSASERSQARLDAPEQGLKIDRLNPDVRVMSSAVLTDASSKRSAAVITLRNTSRREIAALPLAFTLSDAGGRELFTNASPGAGADLTTVPSLPPGGTLSWVHNAITDVAGATAVHARVGAGAADVGQVPALRLSTAKLGRDPVDGTIAVGKVFNRSQITQQRLVVFGVARRAGKVVAAGRAVLPTVKPGLKGASYTMFFVGDPRGAKLSIDAPPVTFR